MSFFVDVLLFNLLIGISFGIILFLLGSGMSLTLGLMRIVNLAHGALYMVGAYVGLTVFKNTGSFLLGVLAGGICAGLLGLIMEIGFLRRLYKRELDQVLLTIGIIYILSNLVQWIWGATPLSGVTPSFLSSSIPMGRITFPVFRLAIIVFGVFAAIGLWLFQEKTRIGAMIRAGMDNSEMTMGLGINLKVIFAGVFAFGAFVAGICGLIGSPLLGVNLTLAWDTLLLGMIVVIVGGVGSIQGALAGGLIIGIVSTFGQAFFPEMAYFSIYLVLIIILLFRPAGLLGRVIPTGASENAASAHDQGFSMDEEGVLAKNSPASWFFAHIPYLACGIILFILPPFLPTYLQSLVIKIIIFAIFAMSLDLALGYTGLLSLGHAAFFGISGYAAGIMSINFGIESFWIILPLSLIATGLFALVIGFLALRVTMVYFLLLTLAFGQLLCVGAMKWRAFTGGTDGIAGIPFPSLGIPDFSLTTTGFYYLVLICFLVCFFLLRRIIQSSFGKALIGIRENELRMQALGFNTWTHKYIAFVVSAIFAGVAGCLFAFFYGIIVPDHLGILTSAYALLMVAIGGPGTLFGPVIGAAFIILAEHFSSIYAPERWPLFLGVVFVLCVIFLRGGFARHFSRFWMKWRSKYAGS